MKTSKEQKFLIFTLSHRGDIEVNFLIEDYLFLDYLYLPSLNNYHLFIMLSVVDTYDFTGGGEIHYDVDLLINKTQLPGVQ